MQFILKNKKIFTKIILIIFVFGVFSTSATKIFAAQDTVNAGIVAVDNSTKELDFGCFGGKEGTSRIAGCTAALTYYLMFKPAFWVMSWMSIFFNFTLLELVVSMGYLVNNYMPGVMTAWTVLRDLANVFLVFLTIYVGIATILGISGYGYKQLLWRIVLAALFVNFSSTFTKLIIDISNMAAIQTYSMFIDSTRERTNGHTSLSTECLNNRTENVSGIQNTDACLNSGIAGALWSAMKITSTFNITDMMESAGETGSNIQWNMAFTAVMASVLFIVMAFLFAGAGFLLITRFVLLILMLIVSPIALVAWLTKVSNAGSKWWHMLLNQAMFAPLLLLMWWIAYVILSQYMDQITSNAFSNAGTATSISGIATATVFIIVMGFFVAGMIVAKNMGAHGANAIMKTGSKWARGAAIGLTGGAMAYGVGSVSSWSSGNYRRMMAKAQETDADGKYKRTGIHSRVMRKMAGGKIDRATNAALSAGANKRFMGTKSLSERNARSIKANLERKEELRKESKNVSVDEAISTLNNPDERLARKIGEETERSIKARQTIARASTEEIEAARTRNKKAFKTDAVKEALTKRQATELSKKVYDPEEKVSLKRTAYRHERAALKGDVPETEMHKEGTDEEKIRRTVRGMKVADIHENIDEFRKNKQNIGHISQKTYNELVENKDNKLSDIDIAEITKARKEHLKSLSGNNLIEELNQMDYKTMATMDKDFLSRSDVVENIDTRTLNEMVKRGLTQEKRKAIEKTVADKYKSIQKKTPSGNVLDSKGKPVTEKTPLTKEERNIANLYKWFSGDDDKTRPLV